MKQSTSSRTNAPTRAVSICIAALLALAACGLAMDSNDRLDRAEQAFEDGDVRAAIIDAKDVLLDEPDNVRGRLLLGRASLKSGDGPAAEKELRRAIELGTDQVVVAADLAQALLLQGSFQQVVDEIPLEGLPSTAEEALVRVAHGDALLALEDAESARSMYTSALQIDPDNENAKLGIVSTFLAEGNLAQARANLEQLQDAHSESPRVWLYAGSFHSRVRDPETAAANFKVALELIEKQAGSGSASDATANIKLQAVAGLAESYLEQGSIDEARPFVDRLSQEAPQSLQSLLLTSRIAYADKDWKLAQQNLQKILGAAPGYQPAQVMLGAVHLQSGNLAQAEMYLSAAVAASPEDIRARQLLAESRIQLRRNEEAQEALQPILDSPEADLVSLQLAARASMGRREVDDALEYLRQSVEAEPGNVDLRFQLAATLVQAGQTDEARTVLDDIDVADSEDNAFRRDVLGVLTSVRDAEGQAALEAAQALAAKYSDRAPAFSLLGAVQSASGDRESARTSFSRALELAPTNVVALRSLAAIDQAEGNIAGARSRYESVLAANPDAAWAHAELGRLAVREQDFAAAAASFRRASTAAPDNADYRLNWARAEYQLENADAAANLLSEDIEATLNHVPSGIMLGMLKVREGDVPGALEIADELQQRHPGNAAAYAFEGDVHLASGDLVKADQAYDTAYSMDELKGYAVRSHTIKRRLGVTGAEKPLLQYLERRPLDNEVRALLAESYLQADELGKSIRTYEQLAAEQPDNAVLLNNLAWAYYLSGDARAIETARKARDAMPDNGAIVDTLGWILVENGDLVEGEKLLSEAVELSNGRAEIRYHYAVALARLERGEEARAILEEILADDTAFASRDEARRFLTEL